MDLLVRSLPGTENFLRRRDLPGPFHVNDPNETAVQDVKRDTRLALRAQVVIFNTFEELEGPILSYICKHIPRAYAIGPNQALLKARIAPKHAETSGTSTSFLEEDRSCLAWLDSQPEKSVIYVSFGSVASLTREQLLEFGYGSVNTGQRFLWVIRPDSTARTEKNGQESRIPVYLQDGMKERGYLLGWAPQ